MVICKFSLCRVSEISAAFGYEFWSFISVILKSSRFSAMMSVFFGASGISVA